MQFSNTFAVNLALLVLITIGLFRDAKRRKTGESPQAWDVVAQFLIGAGCFVLAFTCETFLPSWVWILVGAWSLIIALNLLLQSIMGRRT